MPPIPRITVGMGTCGQGNGAEALLHALHEAIGSSGQDVELVSVGCFGACFEEPIVGVHIPGAPLVMLRRVRSQDAKSVLESVAGQVMPPELIYCKIEEWDHITAQLRYGAGYPEIASWDAIPFFHGQRKIVLRSCGLINPEDIEEYIGIGGYQSLYKILIDERPKP